MAAAAAATVAIDPLEAELAEVLGPGYVPGSRPAVKAAHTRLLDLLAGWSAFVQREGAAPDAEGVVDAVEDLYQEAGALADRSDDAVRAFVQDRVVPVLLRRAD